MKRVIGCAAGLVMLVLGLSAAPALAQAPPRAAAAAPAPRFSVEGAAGLQVDYRGNIQSIGFGFSPTRRLMLIVSAERSYVADEIEQYADGYGSERGSTDRLISVGLRYAFFTDRRVSPYVVGGAGGGVSRPNVNAYFTDERRRDIRMIYYGGGVRIPLRARLDAFADARLIMAVEAKTDYFGVRLPVRAGVVWRF